MSSPTNINEMTQSLCVADKRMDIGGTPKSVRKFFSAECVP